MQKINLVSNQLLNWVHNQHQNDMILTPIAWISSKTNGDGSKNGLALVEIKLRAKG